MEEDIFDNFDDLNCYSIFSRIESEAMVRTISDSEKRVFKGTFHPSGLEWNMCVNQHLNDLLAGKNDFFITKGGEFKKVMGITLHAVWSDLLLTTGLLYQPPTYPPHIVEILEEKKRLNKRVNENEIYGFCPDWSISLWIDSVLKDGKNPVINDFKSRNMLPKKWKEEVKTLPTTKDETQVYIYSCYVDKYKYYPEKVSKVRLSYYNPFCYGNPDISPKHEWVSEVDPVKYEKTICLLEEGGRLAKLWKEDKERDCQYRDCEVCHVTDNSGKSSSKTLLP